MSPTQTSTRKQRLADLLVVAAVMLTIAAMLSTQMVVLNTVPAGGDTTGHVWWASEMKRLISDGKVSGWSEGWFGGFPIGRFYYPLPALLIAGLSLALPFLVAFKTVLASAAVALPAASYVLLRGLGTPRPTPALGAVACLPFLLYERSTLVFGGNIASLIAGELAYSWSLVLGLFALGCLGSWLRTGRPGPWAATLLIAGSIASHAIVGSWIILVAGIVILALGRQQVTAALLGVGSGIALVGIWAIPLITELRLVTDPGFPQLPMPSGLYPPGWTWMVLLAAIGILLAHREKESYRWVLSGWLLAVGAVMLGLPSGLVVSNARLAPLWDLGLALAAATGVGSLLRRAPGAWPTITVAALATSIVAAGWAVSGPLRARSGTLMAGLESHQAWPELKSIVATVDSLGPGRAVWEVSPGLVRYGSPFALQLSPYWTDGRVTSLDGLHRESSATSPAVERLLSELSAVGRQSMSNVAYGSLDDFNQGVEHMKLFGVRWYLAASAAAIALADKHPDLRMAARIEHLAGGVAGWSVYEVRGSKLIESLSELPLVASSEHWRTASDNWMVESGWPARMIAESGPSSWQSNDQPAILGSTDVSNARIETGQVRFQVERTGVPVLVKVSYSPGWRVDGAEGPFRVAPNLMVVVPNEREVRLFHAPTRADAVGLAVTTLGIVGLSWLALNERRTRKGIGSGT